MFSLLKLKKFTISLWIGLILTAAAAAQTTKFTYQGRFTDSTMPQPTNGSYDMNFVAFDAVTGGNQFNQSVILSGVQVTNGIFTVTLNFGETPFHGADVFVEISARPAGSATPMTKLSPRQQITSAPYAVQSLSSKNANDSENLGGLPANAFVKVDDSRLTDARNPLSGSANYIQNTTAEQISDFNITGTGSAGVLNATTVNAVGVNVLGTASAGTFNATGQYNLDGQRALIADSSFNLFAGFSSGTHDTTGISNAFFGFESGFHNVNGNYNTFTGGGAGFSNTSGSGNSFFGLTAGQFNSDGSYNTFVGHKSAQNNGTGDNNTTLGAGSEVGSSNLHFATAIGSGAVVSTNNTIVLGRNTDTVTIPHRLRLGDFGTPGDVSLCMNNVFEISTCTPGHRPIGTDTTTDPETAPLRSQIAAQSEQLKQQQLRMDNLQRLVCAISPQADVCKETK